MRLALRVVVGLIIALVIAVAYPWIRDRYSAPSASRSPATHPIKGAQTTIDFVTGSLMAFQANSPGTPAALRLSADFLEQAGDSRAILVRARLLALQPESGVNRLELAATKRRFQEPEATDSNVPANDLRKRTETALRANDFPTATASADALCATSRATFSDHFLRMQVGLAAGRLTLDESLAALEKRARAHPEDTAEFTGWLIALGRTSQALDWLARLPVSTLKLPIFESARADALAAAGLWDDARGPISRGAWGAVPPDALQLAFSVRLLDRQTRSQLQQDLWNEALRASAKSLTGLQILNRLAVTWSWGPETATTLLVIIRQHPSATWAYAALADHYAAGKDTPNLKGVIALWREAEPARNDVEARWARLQLLTEPPILTGSAQASLARLHAADHANPDVTTSLALLRWQQKKVPEALVLLETLPAITRRRPDIALYNGLFLSAAGRRAEAREVLSGVDPDNLLREEVALLQTANQASREPKAPSVIPPRPSPKPSPVPARPSTQPIPPIEDVAK